MRPKYPLSLSLILPLILLLLPCPTRVEAQPVTGATQVQVLKSNGNQKTMQAETLIDAPPDSVWGNLVNYGNLKNILPGYYRSSVLQSSGNTKIVDFGVQGSGFLPALRYQVQIREEKVENALYLQRISGDFRNITASYKLLPLPGGNRTRLVYRLDIDLGAHFTLPGEESLLKNNTEKAMQALRTYCNRAYARSLTAEANR